MLSFSTLEFPFRRKRKLQFTVELTDQFSLQGRRPALWRRFRAGVWRSTMWGVASSSTARVSRRTTPLSMSTFCSSQVWKRSSSYSPSHPFVISIWFLYKRIRLKKKLGEGYKWREKKEFDWTYVDLFADGRFACVAAVNSSAQSFVALLIDSSNNGTIELSIARCISIPSQVRIQSDQI